MRRTCVASGLLASAIIAFGPDLEACGDKSLSAGGIRMQRALAARYPASILMFVPSASRLPGAAHDLRLQETLRLVGHTYREVTTWPELQASVGTGQFNIILADVSDVIDLQTKLESSPSRAVVIPVAFKPTKAETVEAKKQSRFLITAPGRAAHYLTTIADAVRSRSSNPRRG